MGFLHKYRRTAACAAASVLSLAGLATANSAASGQPAPVPRHSTLDHVLLLSVDGLHQSDLAWYVQHHPNSALAELAHDGTQFSNASTPLPSDSFPGMVGQVTGGDPNVTGIYYDDTYNRALLPPGTTDCATTPPGTAVNYDESVDLDSHSIDAGQGLTGLPNSILSLTSDPLTLIDTAKLPVDPTTCKPVEPNNYLKVNTVFEIARAHGLRTAWSDKHPAYQILSGPSGTGVQDYFTPEINSDAPTVGSSNDWTTDNALTQQYDHYKVEAVINEIHGLDHSGTHAVGTPAIFGMNFQTVSTAEKLLTSDGLAGGYLADGITPGPLLSKALDFIDAQVGAMEQALQQTGLASHTEVILSAKHGQSPMRPDQLRRIDDGPILDALNAAWAAAHPGAAPLVAGSIDDDAMILWLSERSPAAESFAKSFLLAHSGTAVDINGNSVPYQASGLTKVFTGTGAAALFHTPFNDARVPDIFGVAQVGVVYTGGTKIAEHGGAAKADRHVALLVSGPDAGHGGTVPAPVETTQIAPTILNLLGLRPDALQAVRIEHTPTLPVD